MRATGQKISVDGTGNDPAKSRGSRSSVGEPESPRLTPTANNQSPRRRRSIAELPDPRRVGGSSGLQAFWTPEDDEAAPRLTGVSKAEDLFNLTRHSEPPMPKSAGGVLQKMKGAITRAEERPVPPAYTRSLLGKLKAARLAEDFRNAFAGADDVFQGPQSLQAFDIELQNKLKSGNSVAEMVEIHANISLVVGPLDSEVYRKALSEPLTGKLSNVSQDKRLRMVQVAIARELEGLNCALSPVLRSVVERAIDGVGDAGPEELAAQFADALRIAHELLGRHPEQNQGVGPMDVVMDVFALMIDVRGTDKGVQAFFNALPPQKMREIAMGYSPKGVGTLDRTGLRALVKRGLDDRARQASRNFSQAIMELETWPFNENLGAVTNPPEVAVLLIEAASAYEECRSYGTTLHLPDPIASVQSMLGYVKDFDPALLERLGPALGVLKMDVHAPDRNGRPAGVVTRELERRHWAPTVAIVGAIHDFGTGTNELHEALGKIRQAIAARAQSTSKSGFTPMEELAQEIASMSPAKRSVLERAMRHADVSLLLDAVREMRRTAAVASHPDLVQELRQLEVVLGVAQKALMPANESGMHSEQSRIASFDSLSFNVRRALGSYGIEIAPDNYVRLRRYPTPAEVNAAVVGQMPKELPPEYSLLPLPDARKKLSEYVREIAFGACLEGRDAAPQLFYAVDGTPVELVGAWSTTSRLRETAGGGVVIAFRMEITSPTHGYVGTGANRKLVELSGEPAGVEFEVAISPDRRINVSSPVHAYCGDIGTPIWNRKEPVTLGEILQPGADPTLVRSFLLHMRKEHIEINFQFRLEVAAFLDNRDRTPEQAQELVNKFITQEAVKQVNIEADLRKRIEQAAANPAAFDELVKLLGDAMKVIDGLLGTNAVLRFRKEAIEAVKAAAIRTAKDRELADAVPWTSGLATAAQTITPHKRDQKSQDEATKVGVQVSFLARRNKSPEQLSAIAHVLCKVLDTASDPDGSKFKHYVATRVRGLAPADRVSLRYNIEMLPDALRRDRRLSFLRAATLESLQGTREGRMNPESVLAETANEGEVDPRLIAQWVENGRIGPDEFAPALSKVTPRTLLNISAGMDFGVSPSMKPLLQEAAASALILRAENLDRMGRQFKADVEAFLSKPRAAIEELGTLAKLATLYASYLNEFSALHREPTGLDQEVETLKTKFADNLDAMFVVFQLPKSMDDETAIRNSGVALANVFAIFGASAHTRVRVAELVEDKLRLTELQKQENNKEALQAEVAKRERQNTPPDADEPPPPPPEDSAA